MNTIKVKESFLNDRKLPLVVTPDSEADGNCQNLTTYIKENQAWLNENLLKYGAILFRGFNVTEPPQFSDFVKACQLGNFFEYIGGGSPRTRLSEGVFTSTEAAPTINIAVHNEMSYSKNFPNHIYFCSAIAAEEGGETPLADARQIYKDLSPKVRDKLEKTGVQISRYFYGNEKLLSYLNKKKPMLVNWMKSYQTEDKKKIEQFLREEGAVFRWDEKTGGLHTSLELPAFREHPKTGEKVWFNYSLMMNRHNNVFYDMFGKRFKWLMKFMFFFYPLPMATDYKGGEMIEAETINHIIKTIEKNTVAFPWQKGDVIVVDNYLTMHGRKPFKGKRSTFASLTK